MTPYVLTPAGERWQLPPALHWELNYTAGVPCDSFRISCPWPGDGDSDPRLWYRFEAWEGGAPVFRGVVDECVRSLSPRGRLLELSGRGMAALLLDNEALPQDYEFAALEDILRDHVRPYGIAVRGVPSLPGVARFSVAAGSSEWTVLYDFARHHAGVCPRFDREGRLVLDGWEDSGYLLIGDGTPVTSMERTDRRYGVLSQIWMRERYRDRTEKLEDPDFAAQGGMARRVITMPGRPDWQTMRYNGRFQLARSASGRERLRLTLPRPFCAKPGDLVEVQRTDWPLTGTWRAAEVSVFSSPRGAGSRLVLAPPDFIV